MTARVRFVNGLAGCVQLRRVASVGRLVGVYRTAEAGIDSNPDSPWATVCEKHGTMVTHRTRKQAVSNAPWPVLWCDACHDAEAEAIRQYIDKIPNRTSTR